jgi:K+/H+ antiporter YhaU regulatory subunit KhtT
MGNSWASADDESERAERIRSEMVTLLERTTGLEPATPTLAIAWQPSHASPPVSDVPLSGTVLALLSHLSHEDA